MYVYNCSREALSVVAFGPSVRVCVLVNSSAVPRDSGRGPPAAAPSAVETADARRPRRARAAIFTPCLHRLRRASVEVARLTTANFIASDSAHFGGVDGSLRRAALREQVLEVGLNSWKLPRCVSADGLPCLVDEE